MSQIQLKPGSVLLKMLSHCARRRALTRAVRTLLKICLTSMDSRPRKPRVGRKDLLEISYTSQLIADFVPNVVAMATGVGRGRISLASLNRHTPKTPVIRKDLGDISYIGRVMADFVPNFVAMATCWSRYNLSVIIQ